MHPDRTPEQERRLLVSQLHRVQGELTDRARVLARTDQVRRPSVWAAVKADVDALREDIAGYRVLIAAIDAEPAPAPAP